MTQRDTDYVDAVLPRRRTSQLPNGACDSHNHVFGPFDTLPLKYPPDHAIPLAPAATYLQMLDRAGLQRGVLVQPTQYGFDNAALLQATAASRGRLRGIAAVDAGITDNELQRFAENGVVGLRFVEAPLPSGAPRPGAAGFDAVADLSSRMRGLNFSINVWARNPTLMENIDKLLAPGLPLVLEHMGMLDASQGVDGEHFQTLLSLLREGRLWMKLSFCRCSAAAPHYEDLRPFVDAMVSANPAQLVWGSDWPFIRMLNNEPDVTGLLDVFLEWVDDAALQQQILTDNAARLFSFNDV